MNIVTKTTSNDILIQSINTLNSQENFMFDIMVLVENKEKLLKFIREIESLPDVINVERLIK